jgi:hypothetical protein
MASFEMLYGRRCRTPIFWNEIGERQIFVPDIIQDTEKQVRLVRENLKVAQSRQKSDTDHRRRELDDFKSNESSHQGSLRHPRSWSERAK